MHASPQFQALLRAYVGEAEAWAREGIYRRMVEEFENECNSHRHMQLLRRPSLRSHGVDGVLSTDA
jgi:hypothetical protein